MSFRGVALKGARWFVWVLLAWICLRGVVSIVAPPPAASPAAPEAKVEPSAPVEREEPMAFAALFAREYLAWAPGDVAVRARAERLQPFLAPQLDRQAGWAPGAEPVTQSVVEALPYRLQEREKGRWLVTVAATVAVERPAAAEAGPSGEPTQGAADQGASPRLQAPVTRTLWLAVPVAGGDGRFVIYDLPTQLPQPAPAAFDQPLLPGETATDEGGQIRALLDGFFRAYVAGKQGDAAYFLLPGLSVASLDGSLQYREVTELNLRRDGEKTLAAAVVTMEDPVGGALLRSRYTLTLAQRDGRWYIQEIIEKGA